MSGAGLDQPEHRYRTHGRLGGTGRRAQGALVRSLAFPPHPILEHRPGTKPLSSTASLSRGVAITSGLRGNLRAATSGGWWESVPTASSWILSDSSPGRGCSLLGDHCASLCYIGDCRSASNPLPRKCPASARNWVVTPIRSRQSLLRTIMERILPERQAHPHGFVRIE